MRLIGMLDSPYVRRVAVSMTLLDIPFVNEQVSVFSTFEQFRNINPVVKAPTLVCGDGTVLMDSTLMIDWVESEANRSLMPANGPARLRALRIVGLALAACEKTVQIVYEYNLRPREKLHAPWVDRVHGQLLAAYGQLEAAWHDVPASQLDAPALAGRVTQAEVTSAIAWQFTGMLLPGRVPAADYPRLAALSAAAETLPAFLAWPPA
jgi:glutathione S-transferase